MTCIIVIPNTITILFAIEIPILCIKQSAAKLLGWPINQQDYDIQAPLSSWKLLK